MNGPGGFLNLRKPRGITSHDAIESVRGILGVNAGHGGTLDPIAEGVLPVALGHATRFLAYLRHDKEYEAVMRLGVTSDTLDVTGALTPPVEITSAPSQIRAAGETLVGLLDLPVPAFSAVQVDGRRLYDAAREAAAGGRPAPESPVRRMQVFSLEVLEVAPPQVRFTLSCAGGVYVRSVIAEWGRLLGCGAIMERLVRTRAGSFALADSVDLESLRFLAEAGRAAEAILPAARALGHVPEAGLDAASVSRLLHGQPAPAPAGLSVEPGAPVRLTDPAGRMIGLGRLDGGALVPLRLLPAGESIV
ncbi:MAG: tRNA pseudouridine(55) synthase TruB [Candidatus Coatesbacteria bacterium]